MFWLKACPKCQGDLYAAGDHYGSFVVCLQCGRESVPGRLTRERQRNPELAAVSRWRRADEAKAG